LADAVEPLLRDLVAWLAKEKRSYLDVMDAWRTSCPRLPVWEEANARGLVTRQHRSGVGAVVRVTAVGRALLERTRA
jgi:D-3-phosphoglycerate dehydrogenase